MVFAVSPGPFYAVILIFFVCAALGLQAQNCTKRHVDGHRDGAPLLSAFWPPPLSLCVLGRRLLCLGSEDGAAANAHARLGMARSPSREREGEGGRVFQRAFRVIVSERALPGTLAGQSDLPHAWRGRRGRNFACRKESVSELRRSKESVRAPLCSMPHHLGIPGCSSFRSGLGGTVVVCRHAKTAVDMLHLVVEEGWRAYC